MSGDTEYASSQHVGLDSRSKGIQDQVDYVSEIIGFARIARFLPNT